VSEGIVTHSAEETIAWGREFASRVKAPLMILLSGDLGSGKTTLTKGIVSGLGAAAEEDVTSPTFTLLHVYGPENAEQKVFHGDLYRIEKFHDFETLGMEDIFLPSPPSSSSNGRNAFRFLRPGPKFASSSNMPAATPAESS